MSTNYFVTLVEPEVGVLSWVVIDTLEIAKQNCSSWRLWILYTFDMRYKKLHVMDPTKNFSLTTVYDRKHAQTVRLMKRGMRKVGALSSNEGWEIHSDCITSVCMR